ncbi:uncharacterized protein LOC116250638 [Nymphaea colorata]|nr:uncharacterized protein LOC116250638 [Nymphaea colorata]
MASTSSDESVEEEMAARERAGEAAPHQPWSGVSAERERKMRLWGILIFGVIGATATTYAVTQLRRTIGWFYTQLSRPSSNTSWSSSSNSGRTSFTDEVWKRYNRRMQEKYQEEIERVERIRRMQSIFNQERIKYQKSYEKWRENGPGAYQHFQQDDWYWKTETSYKDQRTNSGAARTGSGIQPMSHHYAVLGLDRFRATPYTDAEIKTAFREKAKEYHPDQNQGDKEAAETKFKQVMVSYEAIKSERRVANY